MSVRRSMWLSGVAVLMGAAFLAAKPAGDSADSTAAPKRQRTARLTKPWNELKDLTDDEKTKILGIHEQANEQVSAIRTKEHQDILAVLSDEQRKEVAELEAKDKEQARQSRSRKSTGAAQSPGNSGGASGDNGAK